MISVCVITYNQQPYIAQCLESILAQKVTVPFKIVISDDASTDGTREICEQFSINYPERIDLHINPSNLGMHGNWLKALNLCDGKYVSVCEGDDFWMDEDKLQKQFNFLETNKEYVLHCGQARIESENKILSGKTVHPELGSRTDFTIRDLMTDNPVVTCTAFFANIGFKEWPLPFKKAKVFDWFLWIYLLENTGCKIYYSPDYLGVYRVHNQGVFSAMSEIQKMDTYLNSLSIISGWIKNGECSSIAKKKAVWYRIAIFRNYLQLGKTDKALKELYSMVFQGVTGSQWRKLFHEYILYKKTLKESK